MITVEDGDEASLEELIAEMDKTLESDTFKPDPSYLARVELMYANRTTYPYPKGKEELGEYIALKKKERWETGDFDRFGVLSKKLIKYHLIPDDIAEHAKKLSEERANGPRVPDVVDFAKKKVSEAITTSP
jgi:hypothetical protein